MEGLSLILTGRWAAYRDYLIAETETDAPGSRWTSIRPMMTPWILLLLVGGLLSVLLDVLFNIGELGKIIVLAPFFFVTIAGGLYGGWVIIYFGFRADIRRLKEARASDE